MLTAISLLTFIFAPLIAGSTLLDHLQDNVHAVHIKLLDEQGIDIKGHPSSLSAHFRAFDRNIIIDLEKNHDLFSPNYKEVTWSSSAGFAIQDHGTIDCYYTGRVRGDASSLASFSLCQDMMTGYYLESDAHSPVHIEDVHFHVTHNSGSDLANRRAEELSQQGSHLVYRRSDLSSRVDTGVDRVYDNRPQRSSTQRKALDTGACDNNPTKYVELLLVNDASYYAVGGSDTQTLSRDAFNVIHDTYLNAGFNCTVDVRLVGQLTYISEVPDAIVYRSCDTLDDILTVALAADDACCLDITACPADTTTNCLSASDVEGTTVDTTYVQSNPGCFTTTSATSWSGSTYRKDLVVYSIDSTDASEYDTQRLLDSFTAWFNDNHADLESLFSSSQIDNAVLFSGHDFAASTRGLAHLGGMCTTSSNSIIQVSADGVMDSVLYTGIVTAHEIGHNFEMTHPGNGPEYGIMSISMATTDPYTFFHSDNYNDINVDYFQTAYGVDTEYCLDNEPRALEEDPAYFAYEAVCGNGIVDYDAGEECDPGFGLTDSCCDSATCLLTSDCVCSDADPCCEGGSFKVAGTLCRAAVNTECDSEEVCTGDNSLCPDDVMSSTGVPCSSEGQCHEGECYTHENACQNTYGMDDTQCWFNGNTWNLSPLPEQEDWICWAICWACADDPPTATTTITGDAILQNGYPCSTDTVDWGYCVEGWCVATEFELDSSTAECNNVICADGDCAVTPLTGETCVLESGLEGTCDDTGTCMDVPCPGVVGIGGGSIFGNGCDIGATEGFCSFICDAWPDETYEYECIGGAFSGCSRTDGSFCGNCGESEVPRYTIEFTDFQSDTTIELWLADLPQLLAESLLDYGVYDASQFTVVQYWPTSTGYYVSFDVFLGLVELDDVTALDDSMNTILNDPASNLGATLQDISGGVFIDESDPTDSSSDCPELSFETVQSEIMTLAFMDDECPWLPDYGVSNLMVVGAAGLLLLCCCCGGTYCCCGKKSPKKKPKSGGYDPKTGEIEFGKTW